MGQMAQAIPDARRRAAIKTRLGDLLAEHVGSPAQAAEAYRSALSDVEGYASALRGLERVGLAAGSWEELAATMKAAAESTGEEGRPQWLRKLAAVLAWRLDRPKEAIAALRELASIEPYDAASLREMVLLHLREEQWQEAADTLSALAESTADPALAAAYIKEEVALRTTHLREDPLEKLVAALTTRPDDREILALLLLRDPEPATLARVLAASLETASDPAERALTMMKLASAARAAGDDGWQEWLDRAVQEMPTFLPAIRQARFAAQERQDWPRVVELLEAEAAEEATARPESRVEVLRRAAEISAETLTDKARAREALARAFDIGPGNEAVASELSARLREESQWRELAEVLSRHAGAIDAGRQPTVLFDLACVLRDQLQSPTEAGRTLERILLLDRRHAGALVALGDIHFGAGSWQKAIKAYSSAEEVLERHSPLWRHARLRRAEVLSERLGLFPDAEALVKDALSDRADDRELLVVLARVLRGARNWAGVEAVLDRLIRSALPEEAASLWVERGRMALAQRDAGRVAECLKRAAELSLQATEAFAAVRAFASELPPEETAHLLKDVLYHAPPARQGATGPMRLLVAELMATQGRGGAAESEVRLALELLPDDVNAWILLSRTSSNNAEIGKALGEALRLDPFQPGIYQGLVKLGEKDARQADLMLRAAQVLTAFGSYSAGVKPDSPPQGDKRLSRSEVVAWVVHPAEPRRALELLAQSGTKLATLYHQPDTGALEPLSQGNEVGRLVDVVARIFGVDKYDAFYTKQTSVTVSLWLDERPRVIVGPQAASAPQPLLRFHLGRVFSLLASGSAVASILPAEEIRRLVEALAGQQIVNIGEPEHVQKLGKVLGWMARRGIAQAARDYASAPEDMTGWQAAAEHTANRGGLLACADIAAARAALHAMAGVPLPAPGAADTWDVSRSVPGLGALLSYAVSSEYASARSRIA
jgi:tetratricopeptide (TPR) repeat protein